MIRRAPRDYCLLSLAGDALPLTSSLRCRPARSQSLDLLLREITPNVVNISNLDPATVLLGRER